MAKTGGPKGYHCLQDGRQPGHGLVFAEQSAADLGEKGQLLVGVEVVEGRRIELPHPFVIVADHVDEHAKGLPE